MTRRRRRSTTRGSDAGRKATDTLRRRLGGRSARIRAAVLQSAFRLLMDKGIDALTIAEVAAQAGVHETSIYRRWGTKHALARDACLQHAEIALAIPDTGALRSDLIVLLERLVAMLASPEGRALLALSSSQHPHVVAARHTFWQRRFSLIRTVFEKATSRGEFPRRADPTPLVEALIAPLYFRALITGRPLDHWLRTDMIDRLLSTYGVRAGEPTGNPRARRPSGRRLGGKR